MKTKRTKESSNQETTLGVVSAIGENREKTQNINDTLEQVLQPSLMFLICC